MSTLILSCKFLTALSGLLIPGYAAAKTLRLRSPLFAAFPLSALIICQSVTALAIFGGRITFPVMALILSAVTTACGVSVKLRKPPEQPFIPVQNSADESSPWANPALAMAVLLILATAFRTTLYPLGGFDTFTRWDALAREMLRYGSLSFYPPVSGADFSIYTLPDGFPPLVASVYWWIYAATGAASPQLTAISVTLQLASILGLSWYAAETAFGKRAASFTLLALTASPLLSRSIEIGQESGFLTLAVAGQICFALAAVRKPATTLVFAAALFAALGSLAREYGPALALPGFLILVFNPDTRRHAWRYAAIAAIVASPWYIRNWLIAGSPLYPVSLPGSPHINELLNALMKYYGEIFGLSRYGVKEWLELGNMLIAGGSVALVVALPYLAVKGRRLYPYILSLLLVSCLWLWSIGSTSGGIVYSMRVLAPSLVILAMIAGKAVAEAPKKSPLRYVSWLLIPAALWGILSALSFPLQPLQLSTALLSTKGETPEFCEAGRKFASHINSLDIPATGVLTDSPYLAVILKRETRFRPVIIWSPEVSFLADFKTGSKISRQKLLALNIRLVALNRSSIHNEFLYRMPFFKDDFSTWKQILASGDDWGLFELPAGDNIKEQP